MKNLITLLAVILLISISIFQFSCSKKTDEPVKNNDLVFENLNAIDIPDKVDFVPLTPVTSNINVTSTGTLKNISKFTLELSAYHTYQRDLQFELIAPDGSARTFIHRSGFAGKYLSNQILRFNATFTNQLPDYSDFLTGNYKESRNVVSTSPPSNFEPLFVFLQNKNINGDWKLRATDWEVVNAGKIISWRIIFSDGAI